MNASFLSGSEGVFLLCAVSCYLCATLGLWAQTFFHADEQSAQAETTPPKSRSFGLRGARCRRGFSCACLWSGRAARCLRLVAGVAGFVRFCRGKWRACIFQVVLGRGAAGAFIAPVALCGALYSLADAPLHRAVRPDQVQVLETQSAGDSRHDYRYHWLRGAVFCVRFFADLSDAGIFA